MALLQETRPDSSAPPPGGLRDKFIQPVADQILKRNAENLRQPAIGHADLAVERNRKNRVVQAVNQLAVIQLRARNHFHQFFELGLRVGRSCVASALRATLLLRGAIGHLEIPESVRRAGPEAGMRYSSILLSDLHREEKESGQV